MKDRAELKDIAMEIIDQLRPHHLRICEIRDVLKLAEQALEYIPLREKTKEQ